MDVDLNDADKVGSMRVLVVDDHQAFRHALTSALSQERSGQDQHRQK